MLKIRVKVEWVDDEGFHLLAENVELEFPEGMGVFPMPKDKNTEQALEEQHPEIFSKIPTFTDSKGFTYRYGLCFTRRY